MTDPFRPSDAPRTGPRWPVWVCNGFPVLVSHVFKVPSADAETNKWVWGGGCESSSVIASWCSTVALNLIVLRSHIQTFPSVAPVTTIPGPSLLPLRPVKSTKTTASMLSSSLWPPSVETISPLDREITRTPPAAPPTTASVEEGLTAREVIPSSLNRPSSGVSLKTGIKERGSQNIRMLSASAEMIRLPMGRKMR